MQVLVDLDALEQDELHARVTLATVLTLAERSSSRGLEAGRILLRSRRVISLRHEEDHQVLNVGRGVVTLEAVEAAAKRFGWSPHKACFDTDVMACDWNGVHWDPAKVRWTLDGGGAAMADVASVAAGKAREAAAAAVMRHDWHGMGPFDVVMDAVKPGQEPVARSQAEVMRQAYVWACDAGVGGL